MSDDTKPDPVLAALARIEASMAVFTTELATVITRMDQLQDTLEAVLEDIRKRQDGTTS